MNPFRKSREFSLYRQMVFGDRAGAPDQRNPLHAFAASGSGSARAHPSDGDADVAAPSEPEIE